MSCLSKDIVCVVIDSCNMLARACCLAGLPRSLLLLTMSGCCVGLGALGQKNIITLAADAGVIELMEEDRTNLPNGVGSADVLDGLGALGAPEPQRPWLVIQVAMIMKKIVSVIVNGQDLVKSMHFVADDDAFDEVDCQYNNCQFGRWISHWVRNPKNPDRHLERNKAVKNRIKSAVAQRRGRRGQVNTRKEVAKTISKPAHEPRKRVSQRPTAAHKITTLAGLEKIKGKLKPADYYRRRSQLRADVESQRTGLLSKKEVFHGSRLRQALRIDPKCFKDSYSKDELLQVVVQFYVLGLVAREVLRVSGKPVCPADIILNGRPLTDSHLLPSLTTYVCKRFCGVAYGMHSHNVRSCDDDKVQEYVTFLKKMRLKEDQWFWICWLASFNGYGVVQVLKGPKRILASDGAAEVAAKLWLRQDLAVVPCSVRHGTNKFEHYGLLQAVGDNDFAAYAQHIEVAMRRTASMHLARDLAGCSSVAEILRVIGQHQSSTGRVKKLEAEVERLTGLLRDEHNESTSLRRQLRAAQ